MSVASVSSAAATDAASQWGPRLRLGNCHLPTDAAGRLGRDCRRRKRIGAGMNGGFRRLWRVLGPGLVTGAADDDPSGIATYSQAGAQFGYALTWTLFLALPLMSA